MAEASGTTTQINIKVGTYSANSSLCHFDLTPVPEPVPGALMLYTTANYLYMSSFATTIPAYSTSLSGTKTLAELGFIMSVCDAYDPSQAVNWSSSNTSVATINYSTGAVTTLSIGEIIITASRVINDQPYSIVFKLVVTIPDRTYFIRSKSSGLYTDIYNQNMAENTPIHQWTYHGGNTQRWVFTSLGDGTFTIHSANSSTKYYLGVSGDSTANNQAIVLRTGTVTDGMKWKIAKTSSGAYKLIPLTGEANGRVLTLENGTLGIANSNGNVLQQRDYVDDSNYKDEWIICEYDTSILLAMEHSDGGDRDDYFTYTAESLQSEKNGIVSVVSTVQYSSCSVHNMLNYLQNNNIFIIHTHGDYDKFMLSETSYLNMTDLNNVDLSNIKFALLLTCYAGVGYSNSHIVNNSPYNIIEKMVLCGAESVIGFNTDTDIDDCNVFAVELMEKLILEDCTIQQSISMLDRSYFRTNIIDTAVIAGNADNKLR